jgi:hypothetical protein
VTPGVLTQISLKRFGWLLIHSLLSFLSGLGWSSGSGIGWSGFGWSSFSWSGFSWSGFSWGSCWSWLSGFLGGFLFLKIFREEFLISDVSLFVGFPGVNSVSSVENLSSNSLLGDESLNIWGFVESLSILLSNLSSDNVLSDIIGLSKDKSFSNVSGSLWSKSSWSLGIGKSFNFTFSFDENSEGNDRKVSSTDASSARLSLSLSSSSWSVKSDSYNSIKRNFNNQV